MAAAPPLITKEDLEARISPEFLSYVLDDSGTGDADEDAVSLVIADATTWVRGKIGPVFDLGTLNADTAGDLKRIALDVAHAYLAQRHPNIMQVDSSKIFDRCSRDIKAIRMGEASLGTEGTPEPAANQGGDVTSGDVNCPEPQDHFALSGTGDF